MVAINYYADIVIKKALSIGDRKDPTFAVEASICPQRAVCFAVRIIQPYESDCSDNKMSLAIFRIALVICCRATGDEVFQSPKTVWIFDTLFLCFFMTFLSVT